MVGMTGLVEDCSDGFTPLSLDKWQWHPSPLPGQVVLVTTVDADGTANVAPKSWFTVAAFTGPVLGFGCSEQHQTCRNIEATRQFTINVPSVELAGAIWGMPDVSDRFTHSGLTTQPGKTVSVPSITQSIAHFECGLDRIVEFSEGEVFIFGVVRLAEVARRALVPDSPSERYPALGTPFFFLEDGWLAPLGQPRQFDGRSHLVG